MLRAVTGLLVTALQVGEEQVVIGRIGEASASEEASVVVHVMISLVTNIGRSGSIATETSTY